MNDIGKHPSLDKIQSETRNQVLTLFASLTSKASEVKFPRGVTFGKIQTLEKAELIQWTTELLDDEAFWLSVCEEARYIKDDLHQVIVRHNLQILP